MSDNYQSYMLTEQYTITSYHLHCSVISTTLSPSCQKNIWCTMSESCLWLSVFKLSSHSTSLKQKLIFFNSSRTWTSLRISNHDTISQFLDKIHLSQSRGDFCKLHLIGSFVDANGVHHSCANSPAVMYKCSNSVYNILIILILTIM